MAKPFYDGVVLVVAVLGAGSLIACSGDRDSPPARAPENSGQIGMQLTIAGGVTLAQVHYKVTHNGIAPVEDDIPVDVSGATASVVIRLSARTGYTASFSATDVSGKTSCAGTATFDVTAGQTNGLSVPLVCGTVTTRGNARFNGTFNTCPEITQLAVAPLQLDAGGKINVSAAATDVDGDTLTYTWSANAGSFDAAVSATTKYNCTAAGPHTLTISVSDGQGCVTALTADVSCTTSAVCGDGVVGPGERCDPPEAGVCSSTCQLIPPKCGDGLVTPPEQCEPPNTATCDPTCHSIVCGDGFINGVEQCEPPNTATCSAHCQSRITECGNGFVEPPEQCEPPGTGTCDAFCHIIPACTDCTNQNCSDLALGCTNLSGCSTVLACLANSGCAAASTRNNTDCYCGSVDDNTCFAFDPNAPQGACKAVIDAAAPGGPLAVAAVFFDIASPVGAAVRQVTCQEAFCPAACIGASTSAGCGDNIVQLGNGETCEPPNTATCNATCQARDPVCGDRFVTPPETCDPPNTAICGATCQVRAATAVCGDGIVEPPETCEAPNTATCGPSCQKRAPFCGDGFVTPPETCDPPNTAICSATCQVRAATPVCGNGVVEPPEACEPPNTTTCDANCRAVVCGDGVVGGSEQCEPPNTATCDANCFRVVPPVSPCDSCTNQKCPALVHACAATSGCDAVSACIKGSGCGASTTRDDRECYCGNVDDSTCFGFDPNAPQGPCKAVMDAAAPGGPLAVGAVFFDTSSPIGAAVQTSLCSNAFCEAICNPL